MDDDSTLIMDHALSFIQRSEQVDSPFFAVIWFHAPHLPVVAGEEDLGAHPDQGEGDRHYLGCLRAIDRQVGRLRSDLREMSMAQNTLILFCSDNGPEGAEGKAPGSAGILRGRKRSLFEGGIRVPGIALAPLDDSG